ncbi:hypothetical protein L3Y34_019512 [Caenorhabditis briggsae]|uniref:Homeobox domain-containing protein n=1 Tax=Caenorhabditis briggsae TaxID=6238 RepID=A0AAE9DQ10_CAEBR|nr:hypothetical protein L3Y34_019512 [Caenorhabditis briggsae]
MARASDDDVICNDEENKREVDCQKAKSITQQDSGNQGPSVTPLINQREKSASNQISGRLRSSFRDDPIPVPPRSHLRSADIPTTNQQGIGVQILSATGRSTASLAPRARLTSSDAPTSTTRGRSTQRTPATINQRASRRRSYSRYATSSLVPPYRRSASVSQPYTPEASQKPKKAPRKRPASYKDCSPVFIMQPPMLETFKTPHNLSNSQILMLKEFFKEFQFLTNERISWIRKRIGSEVETRTIQNWFKEQRDLNIRELEKNPRAEQDLPSEMALLHMTYDREPDIRNIKFLSWATVHQVSEADVRRYYKERTSKEAEGLKRQQIIQNADEPIKQEIEESPAPIIQNPEEEIKQEIDHNFAIPKIRKRRERLPIVSMQPSELPVTFKNPPVEYPSSEAQRLF